MKSLFLQRFKNSNLLKRFLVFASIVFDYLKKVIENIAGAIIKRINPPEKLRIEE